MLTGAGAGQATRNCSRYTMACMAMMTPPPSPDLDCHIWQLAWLWISSLLYGDIDMPNVIYNACCYTAITPLPTKES